MDVASGKVPMTSQPAHKGFYKAYNVSYWTMTQAEAAGWLNSQFGTNIARPTPAPRRLPLTSRRRKAEEDCVLRV